MKKLNFYSLQTAHFLQRPCNVTLKIIFRRCVSKSSENK